MAPLPLVALFTKFAADPKNIGRICDIVGEMPNIEFPTMGGLLFWDTLAEVAGYKLQKNKLTGHCRILDSDDTRIAWGSESELAKKLRDASA